MATDDGAALSVVNTNYGLYWELWHDYLGLLEVAKGLKPKDADK